MASSSSSSAVAVLPVGDALRRLVRGGGRLLADLDDVFQRGISAAVAPSSPAVVEEEKVDQGHEGRAEYQGDGSSDTDLPPEAVRLSVHRVKSSDQVCSPEARDSRTSPLECRWSWYGVQRAAGTRKGPSPQNSTSDLRG